MILYRKWFRNLINVLYLPLSILGVFLAAIILDCEYQPGGQAGYIFSIFGLALVNLMYYIGFIRLRDNGFGSFLIVLFTIIAILMNLILVLTTEEETFTKASVWNSGLSLMLGPCCLVSFTIYKFKGEDLTPFFETFLPLIIAAIGIWDPIEAENQVDEGSINLESSRYTYFNGSWCTIYKDDDGNEYYFDDETQRYLRVDEDYE